MAYTREKSHAFEEQRETKRGDKACMQMGGRARKERIDIERRYINSVPRSRSMKLDEPKWKIRGIPAGIRAIKGLDRVDVSLRGPFPSFWNSPKGEILDFI